jgi:methyl-accepting chemotaxis protein
MDVTDKEYFESIKNVFEILPAMFTSGTGFVLTDTSKFLIVKQADTFNTNAREGQEISKGGMAEQVIKTKTRQKMKYGKEVFGSPIVTTCTPIINKNTGNVLGTIMYSVSQEKENDVMEMSNELKSYSDQLSGSAQEMASSSEELYSSSQSISDLANKASSGINKMDDVLKYITEISNTTNMLGLNAAIEAARAGEHGRGFTVVAQEIRKLATESKASVLDISSNLITIKEDINNILEFMDSFISTSATQSAQAEELSASSEGISELFTRLLNLAEKLNS